jgi:hypothetical protein
MGRKKSADTNLSPGGKKSTDTNLSPDIDTLRDRADTVPWDFEAPTPRGCRGESDVELQQSSQT